VRRAVVGSSSFFLLPSRRYIRYIRYIVSGCIGIVQTINSQQSTANSQQSTANSQQPTANSQQSTANSQQPTANSQQSTANSQQPTVNSQQPTVNFIPLHPLNPLQNPLPNFLLIYEFA
jgi:cytoskeletal protein RodZ